MLDKRIKLVQGDITRQQVDVIVNAANSSLMGGGGVDGAIHHAGGPAILEDCRKIIARQGRCHTGEAVITTGGRLPAKHVIHTVGPVWSKGKDQSALLANCYRNSLKLAVGHHLKTIAFPNISTGIYHYPKNEAVEIALKTVDDFLKNHDSIEQVIFVCYDEENFRIYEKSLSS